MQKLQIGGSQGGDQESSYILSAHSRDSASGSPGPAYIAFGATRNSIKLPFQSLPETDFNSFNLGDTHNLMKDGGYLGNVGYIRFLDNFSYLTKETLIKRDPDISVDT